MTTDKRTILLLLVYTTSLSLLTTMISTPSVRQVIIVTSKGVQTLNYAQAYTPLQLIVAVASAIAASVSLTLLLLHQAPKKENRIAVIDTSKLVEWVSGLVTLSPNEHKVIEYIARKGGKAYQSEIASSLGMPKSTVSTILSTLEAKNIITKLRVGNKNLILLKPLADIIQEANKR